MTKEAMAERARIMLGLERRATKFERNGGSDYINAAHELRLAASAIGASREQWASEPIGKEDT